MHTDGGWRGEKLPWFFSRDTRRAFSSMSYLRTATRCRPCLWNGGTSWLCALVQAQARAQEGDTGRCCGLSGEVTKWSLSPDSWPPLPDCCRVMGPAGHMLGKEDEENRPEWSRVKQVLLCGRASVVIKKWGKNIQMELLGRGLNFRNCYTVKEELSRLR